MRVSTVFAAIILVLIVMNEAISATMFLKNGRFYMRVSTVFDMINIFVSEIRTVEVELFLIIK